MSHLYPHFINKEAGPGRESDLPNVTQLQPSQDLTPRYQRRQTPFPRSCDRWLTEHDSNLGLAGSQAHPPPTTSNTYSSGQSDLKICLFFHTFWAFWLYALRSCSSSCSDLQAAGCSGSCPCLPSACPPLPPGAPGPDPPHHLYMQVFFREHHRFSSLSSAVRICKGRESGVLLVSPRGP